MSYVSGNSVSGVMNPVARQGNMDAHMAYASAARSAVIAENRGTTRSIYGNPEAPEVGDMLPHEMAFELPTYERASVTMSGLTCLNGLGAEASQLFPNDEELVREVIRSHIKPTGLVVQGLKGDRFQSRKGVTVQLAGTNSMYQPRSNVEDMIGPGDNVEMDVPQSGLQTLQAIQDMRMGVARGKFILLPKRHNPENAAFTFLTHLTALANNPVKYKQAMDPRRAATFQWTKATSSAVNSYLGSAVMAIARMQEIGLVTLDATKLGLAADAPDEQRILALAQFMGLTESRPTIMRANAATRQAMRKLRHRIIGTIFYDGKNPYFEMFYKMNGVSPARHANSQQPKRGDPYGELLALQLDHLRLSIGGFAHAVHDRQRFVVGKATTGVAPGTSGQFNVALGVCRP